MQHVGNRSNDDRIPAAMVWSRRPDAKLPDTKAYFVRRTRVRSSQQRRVDEPVQRCPEVKYVKASGMNPDSWEVDVSRLIWVSRCLFIVPIFKFSPLS